MNALNNRIAAIGEKDTMLAFRALGVDVFFDTEQTQVIKTVRELSERQYLVILISEKCALGIHSFIQSFTGKPYPIILPVPDGINTLSYGIDKLKSNMEKALGSISGGL